jgi:hypothetical protein
VDKHVDRAATLISVVAISFVVAPERQRSWNSKVLSPAVAHASTA